jgi:hypothetical protein
MRIFGFLLLIINVLCILDILKNVADTERKLLWIVVVLLLPFAGALVYFGISRKIIRL